MGSRTQYRNSRSAAALAVFTAIALGPLASQAQVGTPPLWPHANGQQDMAYRPAFSQQQLEQILAPIALYPDSLLGQILMAATLPQEVAEAARWTRENPSLQGEQAVGAAQGMGWDSSVESLTAFPQLLAQMEQNPDWTRSLGEAFLTSESRMMDSVQELRRRAHAAGMLRSDEQLRIEQSGQWIAIEPAQPLVTYVPYYDPLVVYGAWPWASYPPVYWRPWAGYHSRPGYRFAWGPGVRHSSPARFGRFDWAHRRFDYAGSRPSYQRRADQPRFEQRSVQTPRFESRRLDAQRGESPRFEGRRGFQQRQQAPAAATPAAPAAAAPAPAAPRPRAEQRETFRSQRFEGRRPDDSPRRAQPAAAAPAPAAPATAAPAQPREHRHGGHRGDRDGRRG